MTDVRSEDLFQWSGAAEDSPKIEEKQDDLFLGSQMTLIETKPDWSKVWKGMPDFRQENLEPWQSIKVHFRNAADRRAFGELVGQRISDVTPSIWWPKPDLAKITQKRYVSAEKSVPRYPVYIVSKGRWETRLTSKHLEQMEVPYRIVVEPQEYANYAAVIAPKKILVLPFSNLGQGSIPARNWIWEHALSEGHERHWIVDDNIQGFVRLNENRKIKVTDGAIFKAAEDFVDRYENIALAGFNYRFFAEQRSARLPPYYLNTRIYSCILIKNDLPHRWRGRYNEDTDLSIRVLKDGWCTFLFNTLLANKLATMSAKGGNTDELYQGDGRLKMAESLRDQHPDIVRITEKWGRWQHHVDYRGFRKNKLIVKPGVIIPDGSDEFGMEIRSIGGEEETEGGDLL